MTTGILLVGCCDRCVDSDRHTPVFNFDLPHSISNAHLPTISLNVCYSRYIPPNTSALYTHLHKGKYIAWYIHHTYLLLHCWSTSLTTGRFLGFRKMMIKNTQFEEKNTKLPRERQHACLYRIWSTNSTSNLHTVYTL